MTGQHIPYIYDTNRMTTDDRAAATEWVRSLGFDPERLRSRFAIVRGRDEWELHVTRKLRNLSGSGDLFDLAQMDAVGAPVVVHLGTLDRVWPEFGAEGLVE